MTNHTNIQGQVEVREEGSCIVVPLWEHLSRSWALLALKELSSVESIRFNELKRKLSGITAATLSERLKEFEALGLVTRKIYPEIPPRVEYSLTEDGRELSQIVKQMHQWILDREARLAQKQVLTK